MENLTRYQLTTILELIRYGETVSRTARIVGVPEGVVRAVLERSVQQEMRSSIG